MRTITLKHGLVSATAAALLLQDLPVMAQLEEVVVTARKREESILKVPVVANVIGGDRLEQYATADVFAAADRIPGLNISDGVASFGAQLAMRGVGTTTLNAQFDQSVSLNIDGLQMTQGLAYTAGMFDMAQLEVLKGPQALFFGKASTAGVISFTTADPGDEFEAIVRYGYEDEAQEHRSDLILSGPITDTLGLRLATTYSDSEGYFTNKAVAYTDVDFGSQDPKHENFAPKEEWLIRLTALWQPTDNFDARFKWNEMSKDVDGDAGMPQLSHCPDGLGAPAGIPFIGGGEDCKLDDTFYIVDLTEAAFEDSRNGGTPFLELEQHFGTIDLDYALTPELQLTSVTGYYQAENSTYMNAYYTSHAGPLVNVAPDFEREDITQEFRLTSAFSSPVNYMLGLYYHDGDMTYHNSVGYNMTIVPQPYISKGILNVDTEAYSVFGQILWSITPELEVTLGARWTDEERTLDVTSLITGMPETVNVADDTVASQDLSPELTLTYSPSETLTFFGALKQAYKSGGFDATSMPAEGQDVAFDDEEVTGGELGFKTRLLDSSLEINAASYYYRYDNMQVGTGITDGDFYRVKTLNAASADVYGVDADFTYAPPSITGLTVYGAVNYNIAEYDEFEDAECWGGQTIAQGCNRNYVDTPRRTGFTAQDLSGRPLARAPEWTANLGADYEWLFDNGMSVLLGWSTSYSDEYYTNLKLREDLIQDAYFKHNASIALRGENEAWELSLIGDNLNDEIIATNCGLADFAANNLVPTITGQDTLGPAGVEEGACNVVRGRSVWLRLSLRLSEFF